MKKKNEQRIVEVARSFSRKLNLGNYETLDVFTSAKMETNDLEMVEISEKLINFCEDETMKFINNYKLEHSPIKELTPREKREATQSKTEEINAELGAEIDKENEEIKEAQGIADLPIIEI